MQGIWERENWYTPRCVLDGGLNKRQQELIVTGGRPPWSCRIWNGTDFKEPKDVKGIYHFKTGQKVGPSSEMVLEGQCGKLSRGSCLEGECEALKK